MPSLTALKTPGVYIQEISIFPPSVAQVPTAIPVFIGYTEKARLKEDRDLIGKPWKVKSFLEFTSLYGGPFPETGIQVTIDETRNGDGKTTSIQVEGGFKADTPPSDFKMYYSLQHYFANGGGDCYIIAVNTYINPLDGTKNTVKKTELEGVATTSSPANGLTAARKEDEITLILFPDAGASRDLEISEYHGLLDQALSQCNDLQDRFVIMDVKMNNNPAIDDAEAFRGELSDPPNNIAGIGTANLKYGAAYYPYLETTLDYSYGGNDANVTIIHNLNGGTNNGNYAGNLAELKSRNNQVYSQALLAINAMPIVLPPSGAVAGLYAFVDENRGVWKAPANVSVTSVIKPAVKINDEDQEDYNVDVNAGKSINIIRSFAGKGTLIWGSRTLAGNDNEWRYVPVRRFFIMVEESVKKATYQFVFEPNDANTWTKVRAMIENFLLLQWRAGALAGAAPEQAFFVKVGLNQTMTALDILEGRMIVEIGMAVVRPAEFIILKFSHKMQES